MATFSFTELPECQCLEDEVSSSASEVSDAVQRLASKRLAAGAHLTEVASVFDLEPAEVQRLQKALLLPPAALPTGAGRCNAEYLARLLEPPAALVCPSSGVLLSDPVVSVDGVTYQRGAVSGPCSSNLAVKAQVEAFRAGRCSDLLAAAAACREGGFPEEAERCLAAALALLEGLPPAAVAAAGLAEAFAAALRRDAAGAEAALLRLAAAGGQQLAAGCLLGAAVVKDELAAGRQLPAAAPEARLRALEARLEAADREADRLVALERRVAELADKVCEQQDRIFVEFKGFANECLNARFFRYGAREVNGHETYWTAAGDWLLFFHTGKWYINRASHFPLLLAGGDAKGWAHSLGPSLAAASEWKEYVGSYPGGSWRPPRPIDVAVLAPTRPVPQAPGPR